MSTTTTTGTEAPSRNVLFATLGIAAATVCTAVGTFWDLTDNETGSRDSFAEYSPVLGVIAIAAAVVFGLVVRTAAAGNPGRRALVLGGVGVLSVAVFWAGLPMLLVAGSVACALADRDRHGSFGTMAKIGLALSALVAASAIWLAIAG